MQSVNPARLRPAPGEGSSAPLAVLLHGTASTGGQWKSLTAWLAPSHHVLTPDLPGYGAAKSLDGGGRDLLADAGPAIALIEKQGMPAHLVGHSYGAVVALTIAMSRPELVRSLSLIEPVAFYLLRDGDAGDRRLLHEVALVEDRIRSAIATGTLELGMACFVDFWNGEGSWARLDPARQAHLCDQIGRVAANFAAIAQEPCRLAQIRAIRCPTLLIRGERSPEPVRRIIGILAAAISRGARLAEIPGAGHMAPLTHPQFVDPLIADHILAAGNAAADELQRIVAANFRY